MMYFPFLDEERFSSKAQGSQHDQHPYLTCMIHDSMIMIRNLVLDISTLATKQQKLKHIWPSFCY